MRPGKFGVGVLLVASPEKIFKIRKKYSDNDPSKLVLIIATVLGV